MTKYIICENCKKLIEYKPIVKYEGVINYTTIKCPHCNYEKTTNTNYIHYGNDGIK